MHDYGAETGCLDSRAEDMMSFACLNGLEQEIVNTLVVGGTIPKLVGERITFVAGGIIPKLVRSNAYDSYAEFFRLYEQIPRGCGYHPSNDLKGLKDDFPEILEMFFEIFGITDEKIIEAIIIQAADAESFRQKAHREQTKALKSRRRIRFIF